MQHVLQIVPSSRHLVVQTQNDDSARGALRAVQQAGRSDVLICSDGADTDAVQQLRTNPAWVAEGDPAVGLWGRYIFAMARAISAGAAPPSLTVAPQAVLTKSNIDTYYNGAARRNTVPVPAQDSYLTKYMPGTAN
jgi:ribose transport system substrate-binding protein